MITLEEHEARNEARLADAYDGDGGARIRLHGGGRRYVAATLGRAWRRRARFNAVAREPCLRDQRRLGSIAVDFAREKLGVAWPLRNRADAGRSLCSIPAGMFASLFQTGGVMNWSGMWSAPHAPSMTRSPAEAERFGSAVSRPGAHELVR